jgi:hypothetical protein
MFNPNYLFTTQVLDAFVQAGKLYFVRNTYNRAFDHFDETIKGNFIITHYDDEAKAKAHYNSIPSDPHRFLYDWYNSEHQTKLKAAAAQPQGYKIYSTLFYPDWKKKITNHIKDKVSQYVYKHTNWKPGKGEVVNPDLYWQFGQLYTVINYNGQQIKVKFEDIEKQK